MPKRSAEQRSTSRAVALPLGILRYRADGLPAGYTFPSGAAGTARPRPDVASSWVSARWPGAGNDFFKV
jgi:hypothetical protein